MTKILRDAQAFAARVKMGKKRLWLIVEGRVHDRPFFDRVLSSFDDLAEDEYSIRLAEELELDGKSAGGKPFVKALHEYFAKEGLLRQEPNSGTRVIAFALDRDLEHLSGDMITSDHVIYTRSMDVESEILLNGDLRAATCDAYSLTREMVFAVLPDSRGLATILADRWREWITIGVCAICANIPTEVPVAKRSRINRQGFGELVEDKAAEFIAAVEARVASEQERERYERTRVEVEAIFSAGDQWTLVKGKWLANFVGYLLTEAIQDQPRESSVTADTLAKTCLGTLQMQSPWFEPYRRQLAAVLAA